jgi:hypothetical protein
LNKSAALGWHFIDSNRRETFFVTDPNESEAKQPFYDFMSKSELAVSTHGHGDHTPKNPIDYKTKLICTTEAARDIINRTPKDERQKLTSLLIPCKEGFSKSIAPGVLLTIRRGYHGHFSLSPALETLSTSLTPQGQRTLEAEWSEAKPLINSMYANTTITPHLSVNTPEGEFGILVMGSASTFALPHWQKEIREGKMKKPKFLAYAFQGKIQLKLNQEALWIMKSLDLETALIYHQNAILDSTRPFERAANTDRLIDFLREKGAKTRLTIAEPGKTYQLFRY